MRRVCFAFILAVFVSAARCFAADGAKIDAPPDGLTPASVTPEQILRHYDTATGVPAPGVANTRKEEWAFTNSGLVGSETLVRSGQDYFARLVSGAYVYEYGSGRLEYVFYRYQDVSRRTNRSSFGRRERNDDLPRFSSGSGRRARLAHP